MNPAHNASAKRLEGLKETTGRQWYAIDERDWQPMKIGPNVLSGFSWIPISGDESGHWSSYWMRLDPGARSPVHKHESTELVMVFEGVFTDDDGCNYLPGHTVTYPAGSQHSTASTSGCTVLVVANTESSIPST
jgi:anti-sigma factor ChrR (cupin superfamily)